MRDSKGGNGIVTLPTGERSEKGRGQLRRGEPVRGADRAGHAFDDGDYLHPLNRGCLLGQAVMLALAIGGAAWIFIQFV